MLTDKWNSSFWKSIEYLFYLFFIFFPFLNYSSFLYGGTSTRSLNLIIFASLIGIGLALWLLKKDNSVSIVKSPLFLVLTLYLISLTISGYLGLSLYTTFWSVATRMTGIWYFISLGVFMLMMFAVVSDERKHHKLIVGILFSTALYSILDFFSKDGLGFIFKNFLNDAFTFGNTSFAAMYIFGTFMLAIYYLLQAENKKWWMYLMPVILVINPNIINKQIWFGDFSGGFVGEARATSYVVLLSVFILGGIWFISKIKDLKTRTLVSYSVFGISLIAVIFAATSLISSGGYLRNAYLSQATGARPLVWEISEKAISQRPFFGWGADNFERVFEKN
jgi:hypothetical protein